nr:uncharacterized protein LOC126537796 [Dermacentor andersoni]XP_054921659.1 uncharacterized protein LOC129382172 [Dermacentor andersoni]
MGRVGDGADEAVAVFDGAPRKLGWGPGGVQEGPGGVEEHGGLPSDVAADGVSQLKSRVQFSACGKWAESAMALMKRWLSSTALQENSAGDREVSRRVREASKNTVSRRQAEA